MTGGFAKVVGDFQKNTPGGATLLFWRKRVSYVGYDQRACATRRGHTFRCDFLVIRRLLKTSSTPKRLTES